MNKRDAKEISRSGITVGQIKAMLRRAYDGGEANDLRAKINPVMSRASAFNIFWKAYRTEADDKEITGLNTIGAKNALYEFGDYWEGFEPTKKVNTKYDGEYHRESAINIYEEFHA